MRVSDDEPNRSDVKEDMCRARGFAEVNGHRNVHQRPAGKGTDTLQDVQLPVMPPVAPMLAKPAAAIPPGQFYEPKWDGFRSVVFRDGDEVEIGSRKERPMTRYFPEVVEAVKRAFPPRAVIDGEIVIAGETGLDFQALQQRIHPAKSRVDRLAGETPASFVAFDLLALGDEDLTQTPFHERRRRLEQALADARHRRSTSRRSPRTSTPPRTGSSASKAPASTV